MLCEPLNFSRVRHDSPNSCKPHCLHEGNDGSNSRAYHRDDVTPTCFRAGGTCSGSYAIAVLQENHGISLIHFAFIQSFCTDASLDAMTAYDCYDRSLSSRMLGPESVEAF